MLQYDYQMQNKCSQHVFAIDVIHDLRGGQQMQQNLVINKSCFIRHFCHANTKKQGFAIGLLTLIAVCIAAFCFFLSGRVAAKAASADHYYKYYTCIRIEQGDTLWDIAGEYMGEFYRSRNDYIREVQYINHLSGEAIQCGQYITVPYYSAEYLP